MRYYAARISSSGRAASSGWRVGAYLKHFTADELDPHHEEMGFGLMEGVHPCDLLVALTIDAAAAATVVKAVNTRHGAGDVRAEVVTFDLVEVP